MHPLRTAVEAAVEAGLDFFIVIGGERETRLRMGFPQTVVERQPLLLAFESKYHRYANPVPDDVGLRCELSFDALYHCRIPWTAVLQLAVNYPGDGRWPEAWSEDGVDAKPVKPVGAPDKEVTPPDNIRQFRPRDKKLDTP